MGKAEAMLKVRILISNDTAESEKMKHTIQQGQLAVHYGSGRTEVAALQKKKRSQGSSRL